MIHIGCVNNTKMPKDIPVYDYRKFHNGNPISNDKLKEVKGLEKYKVNTSGGPVIKLDKIPKMNDHNHLHGVKMVEIPRFSIINTNLQIILLKMIFIFFTVSNATL